MPERAPLAKSGRAVLRHERGAGDPRGHLGPPAGGPHAAGLPGPDAPGRLQAARRDPESVKALQEFAARIPGDPAPVPGRFAFVLPVVASHITGIRSGAGATAEGWFIGLPLTTRVLLESRPEFVYDRLVQGGPLAERLGAGHPGPGAVAQGGGGAGGAAAGRG